MPPRPGRVLSCSNGQPQAVDANRSSASAAIATAPVGDLQEKELPREQIDSMLPQKLLVH